MFLFKLVTVMLLVAYASADLNALMASFNITIRGQCKDETTTNTTATTQPPAGTAATAAAQTTTDSTIMTETTTAANSTNGGVSGRKKRAVDLCVAEETKVSEAKDVADFHTKLQDYAKCQSTTCPSLDDEVAKLIKESGATAVKVCGLLLVLMFVISYFG